MSEKKRPGPPATGVGTQVSVRMQPDLLEKLDNWIAVQPVQPSRPEAIREFVSGVLDQQTLAAIDEWRRQQNPPPPMADAISAILKDWLAAHGWLDGDNG